MKVRETPVARPNRRPWVRVSLDGSLYVFCLPTPGRAQALTANYQKADRENMAEIEAALGAFIGACWDDEEHELESDPTDGEAVFTELHRHGWGFEVCSALMAGLANAMASEFVGEKEVEKRVNFFGVKGPTGCTNSGSDENTSPTSGAGTG